MTHPNIFEYLGYLIHPTQDGFAVIAPDGKIWECLSLNEARKQIVSEKLYRPIGSLPC